MLILVFNTNDCKYYYYYYDLCYKKKISNFIGNFFPTFIALNYKLIYIAFYFKMEGIKLIGCLYSFKMLLLVNV